MNDPNDRFGMPESAFEAAIGSHGRDNTTIRAGMYVPTRREVAESSPDWLYSVLVDWMWESPSELIPNNDQIHDVRAILVERPDAGTPEINQIIDECDDYLRN